MVIVSDELRPVRVLVVDDSPVLRRGMRAILEGSGVVVLGECASGLEAVSKVALLRPDVVTMDLDMPGMDGLATIERIMADHPTPILVVTGDPRYRGLDCHFEALTRGAIELLAKPSSVMPGSPDCVRLVEVVRTVARVPVVPHVRGSLRRRVRPNTPTEPLLPSATARLTRNSSPAVIAIGASTGGPGALRSLLRGVGPGLSAPIVIVQHMAIEFAEGFVRWLGSQAPMPLREATPGTRLRAGHAYVAVRGSHIRVGADHVIDVAPGAPTPYRPSVDTLFSSVASSWGPHGMGILLTGMGDDGARGLGAILGAGGLTVAQDEDTSVVFGMPGAAIERGAARLVLDLDGIARFTRDACNSVHGGHS